MKRQASTKDCYVFRDRDEEHMILISCWTHIAAIKALVIEELSWPESIKEKLDIVFAGHCLRDHLPIRDFGIQYGTVLYLSVKFNATLYFQGLIQTMELKNMTKWTVVHQKLLSQLGLDKTGDYIIFIGSTRIHSEETYNKATQSYRDTSIFLYRNTENEYRESLQNSNHFFDLTII
jgi:hypothetical protein